MDYQCLGDSIGFMPFAITGYYKYEGITLGSQDRELPYVVISLDDKKCHTGGYTPSAYGTGDLKYMPYYHPFAIPFYINFDSIPFSPFMSVSFGYWDPDTSDQGGYLLIDDLDVIGELVSSRELLPLAQRVHLFPNPVQNNFSIDIPKDIEITQIELVDMQGKILKDISQNSTDAIDISSLESGNYLIRIRTPKGVFAKKLQKN